MISSLGTQLWTPHGWIRPEHLYVGLKIMSFNPDRGVCEYDTIKSIKTDNMQCMGYGINVKSISQLLTPDHDLLIWNSYTKKLTKKNIEDRFMVSINPTWNSFILASAPFEPHKRMNDLEDIKYSARMAASISKHRFAYSGKIETEMSGYEAQVWVDTFFHWNKLLYGSNWMATVELNNKYIRDILYEIVARAGIGLKYRFRGSKKIVSVSMNGFVATGNLSWFKKTIDGPVFNITTKNGSAVARNAGGNFLLACDEEMN